MYQADRRLSPEEIERINAFADVFLADWESHGMPVNGSVDVINDLFIRIGAFTDEPSMCGRAQDAQVRFAKELEHDLGLQLTNRMLLCFGEEGEESVIHMNDVTDQIQKGNLTKTTPFYNNLVTSKKEFDREWMQEAGTSWLNRYFD